MPLMNIAKITPWGAIVYTIIIRRRRAIVHTIAVPGAGQLYRQLVSWLFFAGYCVAHSIV